MENLIKKSSSTEAIVQVLSEEWPLSTKETYYRIKRISSIQISYQGIHKKLLELEKEGVIKKEEKKWSINQDWLKQQINFLEEIDNKYLGKSLPLTQIDSTPKTHSFRTPMELARFVIDFALNCENPQKKPTVFKWWSLYPTFSLSEEEYKKMKKAILLSNLYIVGKNTTALDKSFEEEYKKLGANVKIGIDLPLNPDTLVVGDYVCHIYLPEKFRKSWKKYCEATGLQKTARFIKLIPHVYETVDKFNVIITKSPEIAEIIRKETLSYFK
jgi:hypothetical protein